MKFNTVRWGIKATPECAQDVAFLEETLGLRPDNDERNSSYTVVTVGCRYVRRDMNDLLCCGLRAEHKGNHLRYNHSTGHHEEFTEQGDKFTGPTPVPSA